MKQVKRGETEGRCGSVSRFVREGLSGKLTPEEERRLAGHESHGPGRGEFQKENRDEQRSWGQWLLGVWASKQSCVSQGERGAA